jgi:hypothetical protein
MGIPKTGWRKGKPDHGLRPISDDPAHNLPTLPPDVVEVADRWAHLSPKVRAEVLRLIRQK